MRFSYVASRLALVGAVLLPLEALTAQVIRGRVVDPSGAPAPGVLIQVLGDASSVTAKALTNELGEFSVSLRQPGTYRVHALRIGFRPVTSDPILVHAGETVTQRVEISGAPLSLAAVRVEGRSSCRAVAEAAETFAIWEQARAALTATQLTAGERTIAVTTVTYERMLDARGHRVVDEAADVQASLVAQPWRSLSVDSVRRAGYVATDRDGSTTYSAPGLDVLLSDAFVEDHCFRLSAGERSGELGLAFEPTRERRRRDVAEIHGTLWLDRTTSALRRLEFGYVNLTPEQEAVAGGELEFARLRNGAWAVSRWAIRMPALEQGFRADRALRAAVRVTGIKVAGGELALATHGADTLWARPPFAVTGTVLDSASGAPISGARVRLSTPAGPAGGNAVSDARGRFVLSGALPGRYMVSVRTLALDSLHVVHQVPFAVTDARSSIEIRLPSTAHVIAALCGRRTSDVPGVLVGTVRIRGGVAVPTGVKLVAEWTEEVSRAIGDTGATIGGMGDSIAHAPPRRTTRWVETQADASGTFRLCGVPLGTPLAVRAEADSLGAEPVSVRIDGGRTARVDLVLDRSVARAAVFEGFVLTDTTARAIPEAEIILPELGTAVLSNDSGAFRVRDVPPGRHRVQVRRLGYGPLDTTVTFAANQTVKRWIYLRRVVTLDSVSVVAERVVIPSFDEHRKVGLGRFFTREELAKQEGRKLSDILAQAAGVNVISGQANHAWIASSRGVRSLRARELDPADVQLGAKLTCYAQVYVDRTLTYRGEPGERLFDINSMSPDQIEAIEYFAGPAETPPEYSSLNSPCGVVVIHTRRFSNRNP